MHFLLFSLVIVYCRPSDADTFTKINYLPNGQVGGYELIINNTAPPGIPLRHQGRVSKLVKQHTSSSFGSAITKVDERVIGENSYLNVHSILKQQQQQQKMKYPVKNVLTVPSIRNVNGVSKNVVLRFAQIGPYTALIVPVNESGSLAKSASSLPPEVRDSVKTYLEVQEPPSLSQSSTKPETGYAYAPPTYKNPPSSISSFAISNVKSQLPVKTGNYVYPGATNVGSPTSGIPDIAQGNKGGFLVRLVNPTKGESTGDAGNRYQEFFVPARSDQLEPDKDNRIIANPFKNSGSSGPHTSQFREVYSKEDPSIASDLAIEDRTDGISSRGQLPEPGSDLKDPSKAALDGKTGISNLGEYFDPLGGGQQIDREEDSGNRNFQSGWSLVETQEPVLEYNPFEGPPPGQPEFSDVSPDSDSQSQQSSLDNYKNKPFSNLRDSLDSYSSPKKQTFNSHADVTSNVAQTSDSRASSSFLEDSHLKNYDQPALQNTKHTPEFSSGAPSATRPHFTHGSVIKEPASLGPSLQSEEGVRNKGFDSFDEFHKNQYGSDLLPLIDASKGAAVESAQTSDSFKVNTLGQFPGSYNAELGSKQFAGDTLKNVGQISNEGSMTVKFDENFEKSQGARPSFEKLPVGKSGSDGQLQDTIVRSEAFTSATTNPLQQYGGNLANIAQSNRNYGVPVATSSTDQSDQFQDTSAENFRKPTGSEVNSNFQQFGGFSSSTGQNVGQLAHHGSALSGSDHQFQQFQDISDQKFGHISSDSATSTSTSQSNQLHGTIRENLARISQGDSATVALDTAQPFQDFQSQKAGEFFNAGHRNVALSTIDVSGNIPFVDNEKFKTFLQNPALTTHLKFTSPNGQTTAVLTSKGTSSKVELPSKASLGGKVGGNIVIPKTVVPLPTTGGTLIELNTGGDFNYDHGLEKLQGTVIHPGRHQFNNINGLQNIPNTVKGSSANLGYQQQSNVFDSSAIQVSPVSDSHFHSAEAAAAALAAVAAGNEHFNRFETTKGTENNQFLLPDSFHINQQLKPSDSITGAGRPLSGLGGFKESRIVGATAGFNSGANDNQQKLANLNLGHSTFEQKDQKSPDAVFNDYTKEILAGSDARLGSQFTSSQSQLSAGGGGQAIENLSSHFSKEGSKVANTGFSAGDLVGSSQVNFVEAPGSKQNAAFLSTAEGHNVNLNEHRDVFGGVKRLGEIMVPKYQIPVPDKATVPINLQAQTYETRLLSSGVSGLSASQFRPVEGLGPSSTSAVARGALASGDDNFGYLGSDQLYKDSQFHKDTTASGNFGAQLVEDSNTNFVLTPDIRPNAALLTTHGNSVRVSQPTRGIGRHGEIVFPKYGIPEVSRVRIPNNLSGGPVTLQDRYASAYGRYLTPARQYSEPTRVTVVASHPSPVAGPHTEGLLRTLNGLFTVPKRQLPAPVTS